MDNDTNDGWNSSHEQYLAKQQPTKQMNKEQQEAQQFQDSLNIADKIIGDSIPKKFFKYEITYTNGETEQIESNEPPVFIPGLIMYKLADGGELLLVPFSVRHIKLLSMPKPEEASKIILPDNVVSPGGFNLGGN